MRKFIIWLSILLLWTLLPIKVSVRAEVENKEVLQRVSVSKNLVEGN